MKLLRAKCGQQAGRADMGAEDAEVANRTSAEPATRSCPAREPAAARNPTPHTPVPTETTYTLTEASAEYKVLKEQRDEAREKRKADGHTWDCFACANTYPAAGFGANPMRPDEVFAMCVRPGHWVACSACATAHRVAQKEPELLQQQMHCIKCGTLKTQNHFARVHAVTPWCRQCELRSDFEYIDC